MTTPIHKLPVVACVVFMLGGCFATAQPMYLPDGTSGYRISCDTYGIGKATDCLQKAGDLCGANGYQIFDQTGRLKSEESQNMAVISTINGSVTRPGGSRSTKGASDSPRTMFVKCRSLDAPMRLTPVANPSAVESK